MATIIVNINFTNITITPKKQVKYLLDALSSLHKVFLQPVSLYATCAQKLISYGLYLFMIHVTWRYLGTM